MKPGNLQGITLSHLDSQTVSPELILFDLDGTLLDTEPDFTLILNELLRVHNKPDISYQQVRKTVSSGARALIKAGFGIDEQDAEFDNLLHALLDLYELQIKSTRAALFPDIDSLLSEITDKGLQWGIVTNKPARFTSPLLEMFESFQSSAVTICPDHVVISKPDPEGLLLACANLNINPQSAIYVGDHPRDIEAAQNAGMPSVAVNWGYLPESPLITDWRADMIISNPMEIISIIQKENHV